MALKLYNTLTRKEELFTPIEDHKVGMYTCGPTVYNYAHIGNLRTYIFEDVLKRALRYEHYEVRHVMNITDVGHLTSDADTGEDKMEKGAKREGKSAWDIAKFYTEAFKRDMELLNIEPPTIWCAATDHINLQIEQIKQLEAKGVTYQAEDGIYFDTSKIADYGKLAHLSIENLKAGARVEMVAGKKNPTDFALWKFSPKDSKREMEWEGPWGVGFPGWHIECSAMSIYYLGEQFDIHCGGIDHIPVHHTNEIAQAETATGKKPWVNYWMHGEFLVLKDEKMAKSGDNFLTLQRVIDEGISPLAYRYFALTAHYRSQLNFNWDALKGAEIALKRLYTVYLGLAKENDSSTGKPIPAYIALFKKYLENDLDMPRALTVLWDVLKDEAQSPADRRATAIDFDKVLGLLSSTLGS